VFEQDEDVGIAFRAGFKESLLQGEGFPVREPARAQDEKAATG
jgi:hypothetical protein